MKQIYHSLLNRPFYLILLMLILSAASIGLINHLRLTKQQNYFITQQNEANIAYQSSLKMYEFGMNSFYTSTILNDNISGLFAEGARSDGYARALAKGRLYRDLYKEYQLMEKYNLLQLHFHLPDGTSYLRFHKPEKFGDNLSAVRHSVTIANREKRQVNGFEVGKVRAGFRHVFPINFDGKHVGSVEMSVTTRAISDGMDNLDLGKEYLFLINKKMIDKHIFKEQGWIYSPSGVHDDFVIEDALSLLKASPKPVSAEAQAINLQLRNNEEIQRALTQGEKITTAVKYNNESYIISFLPIYDIINQHAGFLASYKKDDAPILFLKEFTIYSIFTVLSLLLISTLLFGLHRRTTALATKQNQLLTISNTLADGLIRVNCFGLIEHINPAATKLLGHHGTDFVGRLLQDFIITSRSPLQNEQNIQILFNNIKIGLPFDGEIHIVRPEQNLILELTSRPVQPKGKLSGAVLAFQDISERKAIENALIKSEEQGRKLTAAVNQSSASIVITNLKALIEYVNPTFTDKSGYSAEEAIGKNPNILQSGNMDSSVYSKMWHTLLKGGSWQGELENKTKYGILYWENVSISPIRNNVGKTTHYIAVKEDITERKKMEDELRAQELIQRTLMSSLPIGLVIIDQATRTIDHINPAATKLIGAQADDIIGNPCHKFLCSSAKNDCPILDHKQSIDNSERILKDINNNEFTVLKTVTQISVRGVPKILECFVDISERIAAEEQLKSALGRVKNLAKQADAANRAKGMFLANMSHEIRTPLNAILGYSQLLSKDPTIGNEQHKQVQSINRCGDHLLDLMNNILETSKIEAGRIKLNPKPMILDHLLEDIKAMFSQACTSKCLKLTFLTNNVENFQLYADKGKIRQVMMNLISNSIKFTEAGEIAVVTSITDLKEDKIKVDIDITDTGKGIKDAEHSDLFKPFEQTSSGRSLQQGTGLGLAISKAFAQKMHGDVRLVTSIPFKKTHFQFTFIAQTVAQSDILKSTKPIGHRTIGPETILSDAKVPFKLDKAIKEKLFTTVELGDMVTFNTIVSEEKTLCTKDRETLRKLADQFDYENLAKLLS